MTDHRSFALDDLLSSSWDRKIVLNLVDELASLPGEISNNIREIRRFLALKSYREIFHRLEMAREKNSSPGAAVRSVAQTIRQFGIERPALFAALLRTQTAESTDCQAASRRMHDFLIRLFVECGICDRAADQAIHILQNLIRGFVLDELLNTSPCIYSHEDTYERAIDLFMAGLPALLISGSLREMNSH